MIADTLLRSPTLYPRKGATLPPNGGGGKR